MTPQCDFLRLFYRLLRPIIDLKLMLIAFISYGKFFKDLVRYKKLSPSSSLRLIDFNPQLHDHLSYSSFDAHYYFANGWAMRRVQFSNPQFHVDVGSQVIFSNLLSSNRKVVFVDYRPLKARISGLFNIGGDILSLPFSDGSLPSITSLHVIEHIGLGRYGDRIDPSGTKKAADELARVLAPGGDLYIAVPVGLERICFNAHRILNPLKVSEYFKGLELIEFSVIDDTGSYIENADMNLFNKNKYSCGLYWFRRS